MRTPSFNVEKNIDFYSQKHREILMRNIFHLKKNVLQKQDRIHGTYSTPRAKTDKLEEPVNRELNVTRS